MDLRVRCVCAAASFDVALEVEPSDVLGDVRAALVRHARTRGVEVALDAPLSFGDDEPDLAETVFSSGLATGDVVGLDPRPAPADGHARAEPPFAIRVTVVSGPDAGAIVLLGQGRHTVGADPGAAVPLTDASVDASHVHLDVRTDAAVRVAPIDSPVIVGEAAVEGPFRLEDGATVRIGSSVLEVTSVRHRRPTDALGTVAHNRTPYRRPVVHTRTLAPLEKPPDAAAKPRFVLASAVLPVASGALLVVISGRVQFLLLVLLSPLLAGWSHLQDRRSGRRRFEHDRAAYLRGIEERLTAAKRAQADELIERRRATPSVDALVPHAAFLQPRLWERDRVAPDRGVVRLGLAVLTSEVTVDMASGGDDELLRTARERLADISEIADVPVGVDFDDEAVIAIVGDDDLRHAVVRSIVAQVAALHSPEDVVISAMVSGTSLSEYEWLKWLPHVRSSASPLPRTALAMWPDECEQLLVEVANLAEARAADDVDARLWPRLLVVIDEAAEPDRTVLSRVLDHAREAGVWVVWVGESSDGVPRQSDATLHCGSGSTPSVLDGRATDRSTIETVPEGFDRESAAAFARSIAPVRDAASATQIAALPKVVPLFEVLSGGRPEVDDILDRWSRDGGGLAVPVGVGTAGSHVLDLVEQGPHALVAGTSGAGKSEFLQTWVCALANSHPPHRLNLLFVDYKGGAFSSAFDRLPHNVGVVTNLDEAVSLRALTSLRAELDRRMKVLGGDAKDIDELRSIDPDRAPPRLVIVVDEFATLVKEVPDFMAGIVDVAQRGRSLGIHLVLATQRPSGSVNDNILANTNLRISLRVLDNADSVSVIGSPDAAALPVPLRGRAYARTGPGQLHPFQSAFGGAPDVAATVQGSVGTGAFDFSGVLADGAAASRHEGTTRSQVDVVVEAAADAHERTGLAAPRRPWLDPLSDVVPRSAIGRSRDLREAQTTDPGRWLTLGIADHPEQQRQEPWSVDLESTGGLLVFGRGGSGRTTLLRTAAAELCDQGGGGEVEIHVIDAASRTLGPLASFPQVASVLTADDLEPIARLVQVLEGEVVHRRTVLADANADSLSTLHRLRPEAARPRIVVLVDGLNSLREALDTPESYEWFNRLVRLTVDGRQVGIHFIATSSRRAGVPAAVLGSLSSKLVLAMGDADEAVGLGVPRSIVAASDLPSGRGVSDGVVVQVAVVGDDPSGPGQSEAIIALGRSSAATPAASLPELPGFLARPMVLSHDMVVDFGETDLSGEAIEVDLASGHLMVTGPAGSGRSTVAVGVARALAAVPDRPRLVAVGASASLLARLEVLDDRSFARSDHGELLEAVAATVDPDCRSLEAVVFVDAAEDVSSIDADRALVRLAGLPSVRLLVVADPVTLARAFSGWLAEVKRHRRTLLLQPEGRAEIDDVLGVRVALRPGQDFPVGRGLLAQGRTVSLVQVCAGESAKETLKGHERY